ncbi:MAG: hypothetical protein ACRC62_01315 [Microcoleus sp.]
MNPLEIYIQQQTGYLPEKTKQVKRDTRYEIQRLVREPDAWKWLYSESICNTIYKWGIPESFFWKNCSWLTHEELLFLNDHNPALWFIWASRDVVINGLSQETRDRLAPEIAALCTLVESSTGRQDFETRWRRIHGQDQQELFNA